MEISNKANDQIKKKPNLENNKIQEKSFNIAINDLKIKNSVFMESFNYEYLEFIFKKTKSKNLILTIEGLRAITI